MNIFPNTVVTISFQLFDADGTMIDATEEPIAYIHGSHSGILPKLEEALSRKKIGDTVSVTVEPEDAFGDQDPSLIKVEEASRFPPDVKVGMQFEAGGDDDDDEGGTVYTVTGVADGKVVVDGNHPLAGMRLRFECRIEDVRAATADELAHGHVHGAGGHHHH